LRTPRDDANAQAIVDLSDAVEWGEIDFYQQAPGFVFSPFYSEAGRGALHIKADLHHTRAGLHVRALAGDDRAAWRWQRVQEAHTRIRSNWNGATPRWYMPTASRHRDRALRQDEYCQLVQKAIAFIASSGIEKVVVSRQVETPLPPGFDPVALFERLSQRYPDAFVSLVAIPGVGTWLGVSPELLLAVDHRAVSTVALAGTQARPAGELLSAVHWGQKEQTEQALVSDYVRDFFQRQGIAGVQEHGPHTVAAGNLVHLQTAFRVEMAQAARLALANQVLHELHPTSAVCGMPKDKALAFILAHEGYDRSFYSGFLGPVHIGNQSSLYVNLRCMQLRQSSASLYVGGGVTAESDPCAEWDETRLKAETLLPVLHQTTVEPVEALAAAHTGRSVRNER
jgi:isochorismate synthase